MYTSELMTGDRRVSGFLASFRTNIISDHGPSWAFLAYSWHIPGLATALLAPSSPESRQLAEDHGLSTCCPVLALAWVVVFFFFLSVDWLTGWSVWKSFLRVCRCLQVSAEYPLSCSPFIIAPNTVLVTLGSLGGPPKQQRGRLREAQSPSRPELMMLFRLPGYTNMLN